MDSTLHPTFEKPQPAKLQYEYEKMSKPQDPARVMLEDIINNNQISSKEKKKKLKQVKNHWFCISSIDIRECWQLPKPLKWLEI